MYRLSYRPFPAPAQALPHQRKPSRPSASPPAPAQALQHQFQPSPPCAAHLRARAGILSWSRSLGDLTDLTNLTNSGHPGLLSRSGHSPGQRKPLGLPFANNSRPNKKSFYFQAKDSLLRHDPAASARHTVDLRLVHLARRPHLSPILPNPICHSTLSPTSRRLSPVSSLKPPPRRLLQPARHQPPPRRRPGAAPASPRRHPATSGLPSRYR